MNEALPEEFDVIVVGTGLPESILSGALSRIGKKVLHLDHCKTYGSNWSSFNLRGFESWIEENNKDDQPMVIDDLESKFNKETEEIIILKDVRKTIDQGEATCYLNDEEKKAVDVQTGNASAEKAPRIPENTETIKSEDPPEESGKTEIPENKSTLSEEATDTEEETNMVKDESSEKEVTVEFLTENTGILKKPPKTDSETTNELCREYFYSKWRHFNLDLTPKLMFSRGKLVELLIASNVCRYLEFRNVTSTLTLLSQSNSPQKLVPVPCSRTDIFNSKLVTMVEKRMLMRVLTICANFENHQDEYKDYENRPFSEFLAAKKLSKKLQHFIIHSIAMVNEDANTLNGLRASQKFLRSLGRYGNSAFLWTTYGIGELPQAFCRLGAVFGGTFCLSRSVKAVIVDKADGCCIGIIDSTGQRIKCDHLIINECYAPESSRTSFQTVVSRAIYVTNKSFADISGNVSLVTIPPTDNISPTRLIEVGPSCCVSPPKLYLVHGLTNASYESGTLLSSRSQFCNVEDVVFDGTGHPECHSARLSAQSEGPHNEDTESETKAEEQKSSLPRILWAAYFNMLSNGVDPSSLPKNILITKAPGMELGFDEAVTEARSLFETICPEEEFLPRAPNPDEIIYFDQNDEGYSTETNGANPTPQPDDIGEYQEDENEDAGSGEPSDLEESTISRLSTNQDVEN